MVLHCARLATVDKALALRLARTSNGYVRLGLTQEAISFVSSLQPLLEMPVYIPKTIGLMEFETTKEELQHRFHVEVDWYPKFGCSFKPIPSHLWDICNSSFITSGSSDFLGLCEIVINRPGFRIANHSACEYPSIKVILLLHDPRNPWAAIFSTEPEEGVFDPFEGLEHRDSSDPYLLD